MDEAVMQYGKHYNLLSANAPGADQDGNGSAYPLVPLTMAKDAT
jgi:hypothetical protein